MKYKREKFRIAVCDDNFLYTESVKSIIQQSFKELQLSGEVNIYHSGEEMLNTDKETDLLFLDVEMDGMNGLQIKNKLRKNYRFKKIVFITCHGEYMQAAFGMKVIGFEEKPVTKEVVKKWISVTMEELDGDRIICQTSDREYEIKESSILYLKAEKDYTKLYCEGDSPLLLNSSLKHWENNTLSSKQFIRVHKSFIVNMQFIKKITGSGLPLENQTIVIPVVRTYKKQVTEKYEQFLKTIMRRRLQ